MVIEWARVSGSTDSVQDGDQESGNPAGFWESPQTNACDIHSGPRGLILIHFSPGSKIRRVNLLDLLKVPRILEQESDGQSRVA